MFLLFLYNLTSCKTENVNGIIINDTLLTNQSYIENKKLKKIIEKCLDNDPKGFIELNKFNCGSGAGCYDLGYVLTQIVYKIGEENFLNTINKFEKKTQRQLSSLLRVGLEYGDNDYDNKQDNRKLNTEFPKIFELTEKQ